MSDGVDVDSLATWLIGEGYAEPESGYGHVSGEDLAQALLDEFSMERRERTSWPSPPETMDTEIERREAWGRW